MHIFLPTRHCKNVTEISSDWLREWNIKAVLLDVDNTLTSYTSKEPIKGTQKWVEGLLSDGFSVYIVSNNFRNRVSQIAAKFGLPFVSFALKPMPIGFCKARQVMKLKSRECLVVGDQIFTDILGANLGRMKSVLVDPIEEEASLTFKIRRYFEKPIKSKMEK